MPSPRALRRIVLSSTAGAGAALLALSVHGMAGLDSRLAAAAQARDVAESRLVVLRDSDATKRECEKRRQRAAESVSAVPSDRDY